MTENKDADLTLPSVVASLPGKYREPQLVLTIVFHPLVSRIGETAIVPRGKGQGPWVLGRRNPVFHSPEGAATLPLDDPHVSRQALEFEYEDERLILRRHPTSSRCRVDGREIQDSVVLEPDSLLSGVPLMLGHSIVLLLRLGQYVDPGTTGNELHRDSPLRGNSAYMQALRNRIEQVAGSDLDVLIRGETGTGKELVAGALHAASRRAGAPMVSVNMAAIPAELAPAALFGSARGAFTGAAKDADGYFQQARGGCLFLDEIGETPVAVQPQLLRALQQREVQSVGGSIRQIELRVISATDAALEGEGCDFKAALRHRLATSEIQLLPLREHPEDIGELLLHFLLHASGGEAGDGVCLPGENCSAPQIAAWAELFHSFASYRWPGNVRQLANFAGQVVLESERELTLPASVRAALDDEEFPLVATADDCQASSAALRSMRDVDAAEFDRAWEAGQFEAMNTARLLQVSRQSVYRRIESSPDHRLASQVPLVELRQVLAEHDGDVVAAARQLRVSHTRLRSRLRDLDSEG